MPLVVSVVSQAREALHLQVAHEKDFDITANVAEYLVSARLTATYTSTARPQQFIELDRDSSRTLIRFEYQIETDDLVTRRKQLHRYCQFQRLFATLPLAARISCCMTLSAPSLAHTAEMSAVAITGNEMVTIATAIAAHRSFKESNITPPG